MRHGSRQLLRSGAVRLGAAAICFVHSRLRPGLLHIRAEGCDGGELQNLPVNELCRELERFPIPTDVFLDASAVRVVSAHAREHWQSWLARRDPRLRSLHLLVGNRSVKWTAEFASHQARNRALVVHEHPAAFHAALTDLSPTLMAAIPGSTPGLQLLQITDALHVERSETPTSLRLSDGNCRIMGDVLNERTRLVRIVGRDRGLLTSELLDWFGSPEYPALGYRLLFDLRHVGLPRQELADVWTQWFAANRHRLDSVMLFSQLDAMHVVLSIARHLSRASRLISVVNDYRSFQRALAA